MPEDEIFEIKHRIGEISVELNSKISDLEKKITWLSDENATLHTQVDDDALKRAENGQRIEKLEKRFEFMNKIKNNQQKELSELKSTKKIDSEIHIILEKRIEELKEQLDSLFHSVRYQRIENIEEVLRDFIIRMEGLGGYDFSYFKKKLNGGDKSVSKHENGLNHMHEINEEHRASPTSKPSFICNKCGSKIYLPGVGELKGKYMCANCNNWQEKEKPPKTWADYGFKKDHQEVTDITEKPPEQDDYVLSADGYTPNPAKYISVEKADLEQLRWLNYQKDSEGIWLNNRYQIGQILEKYLTEEAEK